MHGLAIGLHAVDHVVANVELGGWDTHTQQDGAFTNLGTQLSEGIRALVDDLDADGLLADTVILTVSEFGRTARENGNAGTDHGNAWVSFAAGTAGMRLAYWSLTGHPLHWIVHRAYPAIGHDVTNMLGVVGIGDIRYLNNLGRYMPGRSIHPDIIFYLHLQLFC